MTPPEPLPYHADPQHLWNRLYEALFVRVGPDGLRYGQDRLEPLLWPQSKHLLEDCSNARVVALLEEFLKDHSEKLNDDPMKRAMLQRDLWLVFNWLEGNHRDFAKPPLSPEAADAAQRRLAPLLAKAIGRLALDPQEIQRLPDNYAAAVASGRFAKRFDPGNPERPYLPPDLFSADGPWTCIGRSDGFTAPRHLAEDGTNRYTNSVFLIFLRLPGGRAAAIDYLSRLRGFDKPLFIPAKGNFSHPYIPNPDLPQFPKGSEIALVRRAMLLDSSHRIVASPITESIQTRIVSGDLPAVAQMIGDAFDNTPQGRERVGAWHAFQEFRLRRFDLFAAQAGGLYAVAADESDFKTGFNAHMWDEFESFPRGNEPFLAAAQPQTIQQSCFNCHSLPGVYSFMSYQDFRSGISSREPPLRPHPLSAMSVLEVSAAAIRWKESSPKWSALRKLLDEPTAENVTH